ncbi:hypothetical protein ACIBBE_24680 [Streptomyces sp. NPDC051644]|uniref:hypothetical protein n=1 Tax=Streptomyces sp. NPDC051644 TaxID=3365666 RepID=UPI0037AB3A79
MPGRFNEIGTCPDRECGLSIELTETGFIRYHYREDDAGECLIALGLCPGSVQAPLTADAHREESTS